jgi:hypothetical protein
MYESNIYRFARAGVPGADMSSSPDYAAVADGQCCQHYHPLSVALITLHLLGAI